MIAVILHRTGQLEDTALFFLYTALRRGNRFSFLRETLIGSPPPTRLLQRAPRCLEDNATIFPCSP